MSEENKKRLKEHQKNYREAKKCVSQMKICQQRCVTKTFFVLSFINFKKITWCFNNNNKSL